MISTLRLEFSCLNSFCLLLQTTVLPLRRTISGSCLPHPPLKSSAEGLVRQHPANRAGVVLDTGTDSLHRLCRTSLLSALPSTTQTRRPASGTPTASPWEACMEPANLTQGFYSRNPNAFRNIPAAPAPGFPELSLPLRSECPAGWTPTRPVACEDEQSSAASPERASRDAFSRVCLGRAGAACTRPPGADQSAEPPFSAAPQQPAYGRLLL